MGNPLYKPYCPLIFWFFQFIRLIWYQFLDLRLRLNIDFTISLPSMSFCVVGGVGFGWSSPMLGVKINHVPLGTNTPVVCFIGMLWFYKALHNEIMSCNQVYLLRTWETNLHKWIQGLMSKLRQLDKNTASLYLYAWTLINCMELPICEIVNISWKLAKRYIEMAC